MFHKINFKYFFKVIIIFFMFIILTFSLSGCTSRQSINDLAYAIAIGLDVGTSNELKLTLQISKTKSSSSSSGSSQSSDTLVNSVECSSITSGLNFFNSYLGKEVNLSHCKVIVFSQTLAEKGISTYLYTLANNIQIHAEANIIICKTTSEEFLKNSTPILENLSAKYFEITSSSSQYTGYTDSISFGEFFSFYTDTFQESYAILGGINSNKTTEDTLKSLENIDKELPEYINPTSSDDMYLSSEIPATSNISIDAMGLAVFNSDKLVGELNGLETICHMIVTNKLNRCIIRIPSPINIDDYLDLNVRLVTKPKIKVTLLNNTPFIEISVKVNARIHSISEDSNNMNSKNKKEIENCLNKYLERNIKNYLYKTAKEFGSDISGFGKHAACNFLTWDDWISYNWNHNYSNSFFSVNVDSYLKSGYLLLDS